MSHFNSTIFTFLDESKSVERERESEEESPTRKGLPAGKLQGPLRPPLPERESFSCRRLSVSLISQRPSLLLRSLTLSLHIYLFLQIPCHLRPECLIGTPVVTDGEESRSTRDVAERRQVKIRFNMMGRIWAESSLVHDVINDFHLSTDWQCSGSNFSWLPLPAPRDWRRRHIVKLRGLCLRHGRSAGELRHHSRRHSAVRPTNHPVDSLRQAGRRHARVRALRLCSADINKRRHQGRPSKDVAPLLHVSRQAQRWPSRPPLHPSLRRRSGVGNKSKLRALQNSSFLPVARAPEASPSCWRSEKSFTDPAQQI